MIRKATQRRCRRTFPAYTGATPVGTRPTPTHHPFAPPWCRHTPLRCRRDVGPRTLPTSPRGPSGRGAWPVGVGSVGRRTSRAYVGPPEGPGGGERGRSTSGGWVGAAPTPPTPHRKLRRHGGAWTSEEDIVKRAFGCKLPTRSSRQQAGVTATHPYTYRGGGGA